MTRPMGALLVAIALAAAGTPAAGQGFAVSGRVSTLGLGAEGSLALTNQLAVRAGAFFQPWEPSEEFSDVDFTLSLASPSFLGVIDLHPGGGVFRLTGGLVLFGGDTELTGEPTASVEIGDETYTPQQIGTLTGVFETRDLAPYIGIGFGKAPGRRGAGFAFDLGIAFQGEPDVSLSANGSLASDPGFRADLAREEAHIADDARLFRFYPVLAIGLTFGF